MALYVDALAVSRSLAKFYGDDPWADVPTGHRWTSYTIQCLRLADIQTMARWTRGRRFASACGRAVAWRRGAGRCATASV